MLLAVSGGPDSTALMHAAARLAPAGSIHVATVDHRLRPGSAAEAEAVAAKAARLGLAHHLLVREGEAPATRLQAEARRARYALLAACAGRIGADRVLTGHNLDDQAETVLLRLCAGSGPAGLAGMRGARALARGVTLGRPFLALAKAQLAAWCEAGGIAFLRDPSNADDRFARARLRRLSPILAREGLDPARLARLAERLARDDAALSRTARDAFAGLRIDAERGVRLGSPAALPEAVTLRVIALAMAEAGAEGPERLERLEALVLGTLLPALREGRAVCRTLRGLTVETTLRGEVVLAPAPPRKGGNAVRGRADGLLGKGSPAAYIDDE
ncbi:MULTISPECIES: tRNA lysidine(34) synthetase TilS [unclassified Methylobacterium]|uniref:tRNA(Ile)-lysidine synthase n=1 Tax=Methylobacterium jeotgali TaxID=381630 RepID=A0ABQ4SW72_9HYPH|nr:MULTISPECIES: tRNA lysidine(34) synthetase TilS [unclassified Methylobacterium]PIU06854.1 MAG: tRNA lysidine(34) synthetase TilS [Methylobacterium sp. CG09_land_8_20_14_0_10_71_15]PIU15987.1 MAG: tRNA lysidine(34) synthetase TilS [Methylobacterium sp. CG08_land_8_20_14_0_20_71_15]GBU19917.1 tRNA(Ile)-lysidine synthase [Methylobacterium sp.]GJE07362.1 tRNA(Ile)-lysidine synthase [Methylobacterium jeotgali]